VYVKSWQECFGVSTRAEAEEVCARMGYGFEWCDSGALHFWFTRPAFLMKPDSPRAHPGESFFEPTLFVTDLSNLWYHRWQPFGDWRVECRPFFHRWGDGTPWTCDETNAWRLAQQKARRPHHWQQGDVLIVDNHACMHGREPGAVDNGRKIVCTLCEPVSRVVDNVTNTFYDDDFMVSTAYYERNMPISTVATDIANDGGPPQYVFPNEFLSKIWTPGLTNKRAS